MTVIYKRKIPNKNYSTQDFLKAGIILSMKLKFRLNNMPHIRCVFRSNGLLGEIRTTCYGNTYAVDVRWGWQSNQRKCLTTECKSLREAKSILYEWFESKGFAVLKEITDNDWSKNTLRFQNIQLSLFI